jgi:hypothetical protein
LLAVFFGRTAGQASSGTQAPTIIPAEAGMMVSFVCSGILTGAAEDWDKCVTVIPAEAGSQSRRRRDFNPAFRAGLDPGACPGLRSGVRRGDHANGVTG